MFEVINHTSVSYCLHPYKESVHIGYPCRISQEKFNKLLLLTPVNVFILVS
jgi:hypothetical protein